MADIDLWASRDEMVPLGEIHMPQDSFVLRVIGINEDSSCDRLAAVEITQAAEKVRFERVTTEHKNKIEKHNVSRITFREISAANYSKIEISSYMKHFMYFESLTIGIISMDTSSSFEQYFINWKLVEKKNLSKRLEMIDTLKNQYNDSSIQLVSGIRQLSLVRNQLAHKLNPLTIEYKEMGRARIDDSDLVKVLSRDMNQRLYDILSLYRSVQGVKMDTWLGAVTRELKV
jgi:hypothetical protein